MKLVDCELCGTKTASDGTRRCDRCWELERRIWADVELAKKILARIDGTRRRRMALGAALALALLAAPAAAQTIAATWTPAGATVTVAAPGGAVPGCAHCWPSYFIACRAWATGPATGTAPWLDFDEAVLEPGEALEATVELACGRPWGTPRFATLSWTPGVMPCPGGRCYVSTGYEPDCPAQPGAPPWCGVYTEPVFADGFESGDTGAWTP